MGLSEAVIESISSAPLGKFLRFLFREGIGKKE